MEKTGQTSTVPLDPAPTGSDGALQKGVAWPSPRFTANGDNNGDGDCTDVGETCDGTVTDNLTGLIWLKNANCYGGESWTNALIAANTLNNGKCNLSDSSEEGDWRLPNIKELQSLVDFGQVDPALPSEHPFSGVQSSDYWSSASYASFTSSAWFLYLLDGDMDYGFKSNVFYVWPALRGQ